MANPVIDIRDTGRNSAKTAMFVDLLIIQLLHGLQALQELLQ